MRIQTPCFSCIVRQAVSATERFTSDRNVTDVVIRQTLRLLADFDYALSPPEASQQMHRIVREQLRCADPYREIKDRMNDAAMRLLPQLRERLAASRHPLETAIRFAIAGNIIDFSTFDSVSVEEIRKTVDRVEKEPIVGLNMPELEHRIQSADNLLYLADNSGEIVFDRLLIEQLSRILPVTLAVRGGPVVNDVTREDAVFAGLENICTIIDTGSDAPGVLLEQTGEEFSRRFQEADLVLAKGQGNFETLQPAGREIFHLFMVKCGVISRMVNLPKGTFVGRLIPPSQDN
ncbi:MAG: ARMT1-like domain-containing protein [Planctomycetia bacterium]|nr:ARMT1-like domain-containing protein [Planctomycetia bacterium]